jgi:hypothetical protein
MIKLFCILLSAAIFLGVDAAGAQATHVATPKVNKAKRCVFPKSGKRAPAWVCDRHVPGLVVTALGWAPKSRAGSSFMEEMALADARAHLLQAVRESVYKKLGGKGHDDKAATGQNGVSSTRIVNDALRGTRIERRARGPHGSLYVLTGLNKANANRLIETVTAEYHARQRE